jgi:sugar/nucleoside kinase (ribokinase family)
MLQAGIQPLISESISSTGRSQALVSPDGERTMATYLGAAVELSSDRLDAGLFRSFDHLHLEGYLVLNRELVDTALNYARQLNMTVSLDLASYNVVESNLDYLHGIVEDHVDIVFANEDEARAFTGETDPRRALAEIAMICNIAVVKIGEKGSLVHSDHSVFEISPVPVHCIDTTGAGDLYAAGFIFGYATGRTIPESGRIGSLLAGKVIEEAGAKISAAGWETILKSV